MKFVKQNIIPATIAAIFLYVLSVYTVWSNTQSPYRSMDVSIPDVVIGDKVSVEVTLFREKLCPYILERTIFDSKGNKVFDDVRKLSTPSKLGADTFYADIKYSDLNSKPSTGKAVYSVRIGSKCNPLQKLWPVYTEWVTVIFNFKEE